MHILDVDLHCDYPSGEGEQKKAACIHPNSPSPTFFYLLLKQMRPIVGSFCGALNASVVTLTEINAFNLPLWCIGDAMQRQLGVPGPVSCSMMRHTLAVSTLPCSVGLWLSHGKEQGGPSISRRRPLIHKWPLAGKKKMDKSKYRAR